jgi:hypothetical protein
MRRQLKIVKTIAKLTLVLAAWRYPRKQFIFQRRRQRRRKNNHFGRFLCGARASSSNFSYLMQNSPIAQEITTITVKIYVWSLHLFG